MGFSTEWVELVEKVGVVMGHDVEKKLQSSMTAKVVALRHYLTGSSDWKRKALSDLTTLVTALTLEDFKHQPGESISARLNTMLNFKEEGVQGFGRNLLILLAMSDAKHDAADDAKIGKYNPYTGRAFSDAEMNALAESLKNDEASAQKYANALEIAYAGSAADAVAHRVQSAGTWV